MWWELAQNPRILLAYYTNPPELLGVEIHAVQLHRDGPTLKLIADLPVFPDRPSSRWPSGANTAQAELRFLDLREITLSCWSTTNVGNLIIEDLDGAIRFQFESFTAQLSGIAGFFDVPSISAYVKNNT